MSSKTFHGGVHPKEYKELTEHLAFELFPLPEQIVLPLSQHLGKEEKEKAVFYSLNSTS